MNAKTIPLTLPEPVWGKLAIMADDRGVKVSELIAQAIDGLTRPRYKRGPEGSRLADQRLAVIKPLRDAGWTWPQIAAHTGIPRSSLFALAKRNGLTARRKS